MEKTKLMRVKRRFELDKPKVMDMVKYDRIANLDWKLPESLAKLDWAVKYVDPMGFNAEKTALNFFNTYKPKCDILPYGPQDRDAAADREVWLEWQMYQANTRGDTEPFTDILRQCIRYSRGGAQVDYLPYWLGKDQSKWTEQQKEAINDGPFCVHVADSKELLFERGNYGLRWVAKFANVEASEVLDQYSLYTDFKTDAIEGWMKDRPSERVQLLDYTDSDRREVLVWRMGDAQDVNPDKLLSKPDLEVFSGKNELGFINWAIRSSSSPPLFYALHHGELWANANRSASIKRSDIFRKTFFPDFIETVQGNQRSQTNYDGQEDKLEVPSGNQVVQASRPGVDRAWDQLSAEDRSVMAESTAIQTLGAIEPKSNVQFATVNAFIELSLSALAPPRRTAERILSDIGMLMFKWVAKDQGIVYAPRSGKAVGKQVGEQIEMAWDKFDTTKMHISVQLVENTPTDKLQRANIVNMIVQSRLRIPSDELAQMLGFNNTAVLKQEWEDEQVEQMALQAMASQIQLEQQQAAQQQAMASQQASQQQPAIPGGAGFNPNAGGLPPAEAAPPFTRTQLP